MKIHKAVKVSLGAILALACGPLASAGPASVTSRAATAAGAPPAGYVADFVSTAAFGTAMNEEGDVAGTSYLDPGCGPFCLPPLETVVWRGGVRIVLPAVPGLPGVTVRSINAQGWVAGFAGFPNTLTHAVVWKPTGTGYTAIDLGVLPGTTLSDAVGIDDLGRVVGWSTTGGAFPTSTAPFVWTEATGLVDLTTQGFPNEMPLAISPGGTVATPRHWYRLDEPSSVTPLAPPPPGFSGPGSYPAAINDAGDQVRFQISTGAQRFPYLFRYNHTGAWKQIWFAPAGSLAPFGVGSINGAGDITATVGGAGLIAYGPDGLAQPLAGLLSTAYPGGGITQGGPVNGAGQILAQVFIGQSPRLMRLTPGETCSTGCIRVRSIQMSGRFIRDRKNPGACTTDARNRVTVKLEVADEAGQPLRRVRVSGRFLDDYWMDKPVSGITNFRGVLWFTHEGLACVGAVAFLVDDAALGSRVLDRTTGVLTGYVIPVP